MMLGVLGGKPLNAHRPKIQLIHINAKKVLLSSIKNNDNNKFKIAKIIHLNGNENHAGL